MIKVYMLRCGKKHEKNRLKMWLLSVQIVLAVTGYIMHQSSSSSKHLTKLVYVVFLIALWFSFRLKGFRLNAFFPSVCHINYFCCKHIV